MNRYILVICCLLLAVISALAQSQNIKTVTIKDLRYQPVPASQPSEHKQHDVMVFRTLSSPGENLYTVVYYQVEKDSMRYHKASYGSENVFDEARYSWHHDTVSIRLYNKKTKKTLNFKALGYGPTSSMIN